MTSGEVNGWLILGMISPLPLVVVGARLDRLSHLVPGAALPAPDDSYGFDEWVEDFG